MTGEDVAPGIDQGSMGDGDRGKGRQGGGEVCLFMCTHQRGDGCQGQLSQVFGWREGGRMGKRCGEGERSGVKME